MDKKISFKNDVFFKYLLIGDDEGSIYIRHTIIEALLGFRPKFTRVLNAELLPDYLDGKKVILDVLMEDEHGNLFNMEMQVSGFTRVEQLRFQEYGLRLGGKQLETGEEYGNLRPLYQIIFMDAMPPNKPRLKYHFKMYNEDMDEEPPFSVNNRIYVFLPVINLIAKEKGVENLSAFESLCYVFKNDLDSAIMKLNERMVQILMEKQIEMRNNEQLWSWADAFERGRRSQISMMHESFDDGREEGRLTTLQTLLQAKYKECDAIWLSSLKQQQLDNIMKYIFVCDTLQELKDAIK